MEQERKKERGKKFIYTQYEFTLLWNQLFLFIQ